MEWFTTKHAAEYLCVTQIRVLFLISDNRLSAVRVRKGRRLVWLISESELKKRREFVKSLPEPKVYTGTDTIHYCECGCGQITPIAPKTATKRGLIKGQPCRFIKNHNSKRPSGALYLVDPATGCWVWQRHRQRGGYATMYYKGQSGRLAHRVFYERKYGLIPKDKVLDHLCRNRACVNPEHLEAVTHTTNVRRGLSLKISPSVVGAIRARYATGGVSQQRLGDEYGIGQAIVSRIIRHLWHPA